MRRRKFKKIVGSNFPNCEISKPNSCIHMMEVSYVSTSQVLITTNEIGDMPKVSSIYEE